MLPRVPDFARWRRTLEMQMQRQRHLGAFGYEADAVLGEHDAGAGQPQEIYDRARHARVSFPDRVAPGRGDAVATGSEGTAA